MIISKTPVRISLGAGGTDLPAFYEKHGAEFATAAGSKYIYVMANQHPEKVVWMGMSKAQRVDRPEQLDHHVVREVLKWMQIRSNIEIVSVSDVPANSGLGTSSSFVVGLLNALHAYKGEFLWPKELAEEACHVEKVLLNENRGKQDQYAAAFGGIIWLEISRKGSVEPTRLRLKPEILRELEKLTAFFYTGIQRSSSHVQDWQSSDGRWEGGIEKTLLELQGIARSIRRALEQGDMMKLGELMDLHWRHKEKLSRRVSDRKIKSLYNLAIRSGAIGGNLMGAGGGGYFMFVCRDQAAKNSLRKKMLSAGIKESVMRFEMKGSSVRDLS